MEQNLDENHQSSLVFFIPAMTPSNLKEKDQKSALTPVFGGLGFAIGFSEAVRTVDKAPLRKPRRIRPITDQNIAKIFPTTDAGVMSPYLRKEGRHNHHE